MLLSRRSLVKGAAATAAFGALEVGSVGAAEAATLPTLRLGSSGAAVTTLQQKLSALGYWLGPVTGTFNSLTQQAVYALQGGAGLTRDGVVGAATWSKVNAGFRPYYRTRTGNAIEVNKSRQIIMVVLNGQLRYTLHTSTGGGYTYTTSTGGTATAYTPTGSFKITWRWTTGWKTGALGKMWRPAYWYRGYAIHGSLSVPPYPASHGCCRLSTAGMDMLYAKGLIPVGRKVWVY